MPIGIDISSDALRFTLIEDNNKTLIEKFSLSGLIPIKNEKFIWNNPSALRNSKHGPYISVSDIWNEFCKDKDASKSFNWKSFDNNNEKDYPSNLIINSISDNVNETKNDLSILTIDNSFSELQQESMLKALKQKGLTKSELLWRPVAIALYHLNKIGRENYNELDKLTIIDFDSHRPEVTHLTLKNLRDELVPLRNLPDSDNVIDVDYNSYQLKRDIIKHIIKGNKDKYKQLLNGPYAHKFMSFLEGGDLDEIWIQNNLQYEPFKVDKKLIEEISDFKSNSTTFKQVRDYIHDNYDLESSKTILWNGFPCRSIDINKFNDNEYLVEKNAVSEGAADYGKRLNENKPTYLDMLPGIKIYSFDSDNTSFGKLFDVIKKGEVEGGKIERIPEPLTRFNYKHDEPTFTVLLQDSTTGEYKKQELEMPKHSYNENIPLIVNAEMRPANGNAIVTIEGGEGFENLFGSQRRLKLDWRKMEPYVPEEKYYGPEVYPIIGRIGFCSETLRVAKEFIDNNLSLNSPVIYKGRNSTFYKVFMPDWTAGFDDNEQPMAMFGAKDENSKDINNKSKIIGSRLYNDEFNNADQCTCQTDTCRSCPNAKRHNVINKMHFYAPEDYREELRNLFNQENPMLSWAASFGPGRVFYKKNDFELFVDFIIRKSQNSGYPDYPDDQYAPKYFWSFFRSLCWYEDSVLIPIEKAEKILESICTYSSIFRPRLNDAKFILCAILFSLRFRKIDRNFLQVDTDLHNTVKDSIDNYISSTGYPKTMIDNSDITPGDNLNQYVLRFLTKEASEADFSNLKGLVTSFS